MFALLRRSRRLFDFVEALSHWLWDRFMANGERLGVFFWGGGGKK